MLIRHPSYFVSMNYVKTNHDMSGPGKSNNKKGLSGATSVLYMSIALLYLPQKYLREYVNSLLFRQVHMLFQIKHEVDIK